MNIEKTLLELATPSLPGISLGLDRMLALLEAIGKPHLKLPPVIHVAGTNGKGSTIAFMRSCLEQAGFSVHCYTSPHLVKFNERIMLSGVEVDDTTLQKTLDVVKAALAANPATFFEATTAAAFLLFAENHADIVILETGMGGRLDATNVIEKPLLTAITPIALDHQEYLGDSLRSIAAEKAGIIKHDVPCVIAPQQSEVLTVIKKTAKQKNASVFCCGDNWLIEDKKYISPTMQVGLDNLSLFGTHQTINAATAIACLDVIRDKFPVSTAQTSKGLATARHAARMQKLNIRELEIYLDGGHNPHAAYALAEIAARWQDRPLFMILGMMKDKDIAAFLAPLKPYVSKLFTVTVEGEPRSATAEEIAEIGVRNGFKATAAADVKTAISLCSQETSVPARIIIAGSLYLAGKVLAEFNI